MSLDSKIKSTSFVLVTIEQPNKAVGYKGSGQSLKVGVCGLDDVSSLLGDHDDGSVSVAGGDGWHDGGIHHS